MNFLLFMHQDFLFSRGTVGMTLDRYFKRKDVLPNPHGEPSLNITPAVISSMNKEVASALPESTSASNLMALSTLHSMLESIMIDKYNSHGHNSPFPTASFKRWLQRFISAQTKFIQ